MAHPSLCWHEARELKSSQIRFWIFSSSMVQDICDSPFHLTQLCLTVLTIMIATNHLSYLSVSVKVRLFRDPIQLTVLEAGFVECSLRSICLLVGFLSVEDCYSPLCEFNVRAQVSITMLMQPCLKSPIILELKISLLTLFLGWRFFFYEGAFHKSISCNSVDDTESLRS